MSEHTENIKRYCDMDKFAQSICENMTLTEDEANKFIGLLWEQQRCDVVAVVRCKNCKFLNKQKMICLHDANKVFGTGKPTYSECFCNYGKIKE